MADGWDNVRGRSDLTVVHRRGAHIESVHPVVAVLCRPDGVVVERVGQPTVTTWRSGAKPFQLEASLSLLPEVLLRRFSDEELAVGAASHSGQPAHIERVSSILARASAAEAELLCGTHWPVHQPSAHALLRSGGDAGPIHNNCSGKHAFMLAAARALNAPLDYRPGSHPVQRRVHDVVNQRTEAAVIDAVIDGCGVPCFVLPLDGMATAFAQLGAAAARPAEDPLLGSVGAAMLRHPELVSGDGRIDLALCRAARRRAISKVGAEGLLCVALPDDGLGLALKVLSANGDARPIAARALLNRWVPGLLADDALASFDVVRNHVGAAVGIRQVE